MYENGTGAPQDQHAAMTWYRAAADQGHTAAKARVQEAQQYAKAQEQKQREQEPHLNSKMLSVEFAAAFQNLLRDVAANVPGALNRDPVIASTELSSFY